MTPEQWSDSFPKPRIEVTSTHLSMEPEKPAVFPVNFWWVHFVANNPDTVCRLASLSSFKDFTALLRAVAPAKADEMDRNLIFRLWFKGDDPCIHLGRRGTGHFEGPVLPTKGRFRSDINVHIEDSTPNKTPDGYSGKTIYHVTVFYPRWGKTLPVTVTLKYHSKTENSTHFSCTLTSHYDNWRLKLAHFFLSRLFPFWDGILLSLHSAFCNAAFKMSRQEDMTLLETDQAAAAAAYANDYLRPDQSGTIQIRFMPKKPDARQPGDAILEVAVNTPAGGLDGKDVVTSTEPELHLELARKLHATGRGRASTQPKDFEEAAKELGHRLYHRYFVDTHLAKYLSPLIQPGREGWISLDVSGEAELIPWEVAYDDGNWLALDSCLVRTVQKAPTIHGLRNLTRPKGVLLVGPHDACPGSQLDQVPEEISSIADSLKRLGINFETLDGPRATRTVVMDKLRSPDIDAIHFSGHSFFIQDNPARSHLALYKERPEESYSELTVNDLAKINESRRGAPLQFAFLNSCGSARAAQGVVDDRALGLCRMLCTRGGVGCVIGMQFDVDDAGAACLSTAFYEYLCHGARRSPAECLRLARREVLRKMGRTSNAWFAPAMYIS
jgi:hypothetical protein